jgi:hypothetical protein
LKNSLSGIKILLIALVFLLLASSGAAADFSQSDWHYVKDITLPVGLAQEGLIELTPDTEVFAGAAQGLDDLRIISGTGDEVPYKLEISQAEREQTSVPVSLRDKGYVPGEYDIFTADLGKSGILHNEIEFKTPASDFRRKATVETSQDEATWMQVAEQVVYAFTVKERDFTTRDTSIRYPESTARYLRVKIADDGEGSLEITGATVFYVTEKPAREISWPSSILETSRDTAERTTNLVIDLGTPGLPSYRLYLNIADANFYREVSLEASTNREDWTTILRRADIYGFETPNFAGKSLGFTYPETTSRYLRLVIHDEDSPPLTIEWVKVLGLSRRLVFNADPQQSYKLYYGNTGARRPSYDIEKIFPYLATEKLPEAGLGPQTANPSFVEAKPPVSERFPWLFPVIVAVAVIIIALLLFVILRQARKVLPPPME